MDYQRLFAERIGGTQYGKVVKTFKFTLIENAKKAFIERRPDVRVIDLGVGEPEEIAPVLVQEALAVAAREKANRIYPNNGTNVFKEAAARYLSRLLGQTFDPRSEILHCIGTKSALAQIPLAFINPGDTVLATVPGYPVLPTMVRWLGGTVLNMPLRKEHKFLPELEAIERAAKEHSPQLLLLNYPNNPTGAVADRNFYERVVGLARRYGFLIVQDAAYADMTYGTRYVSPLQVDGGREVTLELYSLSKSYNMQGYRLGFVASNPTLLSAYALVKDNTDNGQFIAIQHAGAAALDHGTSFLAANGEKYRRRLEKCSEILREAGLAASPSPGTFYLYVPVPRSFQGAQFATAQEFTDFLIAQHGIISVPWDDLGDEPHVRFSMTFEVGEPSFASENEVFAELSKRLVR